MSIAPTILSLQWTLLRRRYGRSTRAWLGIGLILLIFVGLATWYGVGVASLVYALVGAGERALAAFLLGLLYAGVWGLWVLTPILSWSSGPEALLDPETYQVYPVSRRTLFSLTLVATAVQPMAWPLYAALLPPTVVLLALGPDVARVVVPVLVAGLGVVWSAAVSSSLVALTRTRKIREWFAIGGALLLAFVFMLPNVIGRFTGLGSPAVWSKGLHLEGAETPAGLAGWIQGLGWTPAGLGARWALEDAPGWIAAPALLFTGVLGLGLAYAAFRWSLGRPEATRSRKGSRKPSRVARGLARVPGATGALVLKECAYMWRDPHLRLATLTPLVLWVLLVALGDFGAVAALALIVSITLNTVVQSGTNLFGRDRGGFEAFLTAPLRGRQLLWAKSVAHVLLFAVQFAAVAALAVAFGAVAARWLFLIGIGSAAAALLMLAGGQWFSVTAPYPMDPRRRATGPGGIQVFLLMLFELAVILIVAVIAGVPYFLWKFAGALAGAVAALLLGAAVFGFASERCGLLLESRREAVRQALLARS